MGNFENLQHLANGGDWIRHYDYEEASLIEAGKQSNRLTQTTLGNGFNHTETYAYTDDRNNDVHGCMTAINTMRMDWDFKDQLWTVDLGGGGTAYYVYDASGQRVRKVIESQNGRRVKERLYLGGFEIYREFDGRGTTVMLGRESLHVMDDKQRIALVETQTIKNGNPVNIPAPVQRYQLGNHLGSASVELAGDGTLISYEEYHPYGTTAFQAGRSATEVGLKRYRYTGKERDEECGLYYHGARYYAAWLGRWIKPDRTFDSISPCLYQYCYDNPLTYKDDDGHFPTHNNQGKIGDIESFLPQKGTEGRYIFTRRGGWLDRQHVIGQFKITMKLLADIDKRNTSIVLSMNENFRKTYEIDYTELDKGHISEKDLALVILDNLERTFEHNQGRSGLSQYKGYFGASSFSIEDLPSNRVGHELAFRLYGQAQDSQVKLYDNKGEFTESSKDMQQILLRKLLNELEVVSEGKAREIYDDYFWFSDGLVYLEGPFLPDNYSYRPLENPELSPIEVENIPSFFDYKLSERAKKSVPQIVLEEEINARIKRHNEKSKSIEEELQRYNGGTVPRVSRQPLK